MKQTPTIEGVRGIVRIARRIDQAHLRRTHVAFARAQVSRLRELLDDVDRDVAELEAELARLDDPLFSRAREATRGAAPRTADEHDRRGLGLSAPRPTFGGPDR